MTTALYRRYRPDTFQDVIGQDHVTAPLMAALRGDRVTHAYLFSGPRGCGKTTSARILARCLNCEQAPTDTPCGTCPSCRDLATGGPGSLDVVEIDAASHNGVDDARDLRERAAFAPARDRYKIFILDEAHMVTPQGFNALLKLVEEPPAHVKFIFATTEPEKVIGTIRSRTHHYPFRLVPPDILEGYLAQLCGAEGVRVGPGVYPLVVRAGGGSVRDTLSVMDQLIGGAIDGAVDYERAVALLGYTDVTLLDSCVDAIAGADGAGVFRVVDRVVASGHDPRRFVEDLLQRLRDLLVLALAGSEAGPALGSLPTDQLARMEVQARTVGAAGLSRAADLTAQALGQMVGATSPRLQLELLMARLLVPSQRGGAAGVPTAQPGAAGMAGQPGQQRAAGQSSPASQAGAAGQAPQAASGREMAAQIAQRVAAGPQGSAAAPAPAAPSAPVAPSTAGPEAGPSRPITVDWDAPAAPGMGAGAPSAPASAASAAPMTTSAPMAPSAPAASAHGTSAPAAPSVPGAPADGWGEPTRTAAPSVPSAQPAAPSAPAVPAGPGAADAEMLRARWEEVLDAAKRSRRATWALVGPNAQPGPITGGTLTLLFTAPGLVGAFDNGGHGPILAAAIHQALGLELQVHAIVTGGDGPGGAGGSGGGPSRGSGGPGRPSSPRGPRGGAQGAPVAPPSRQAAPTAWDEPAPFGPEPPMDEAPEPPGATGPAEPAWGAAASAPSPHAAAPSPSQTPRTGSAPSAPATPSAPVPSPPPARAVGDDGWGEVAIPGGAPAAKPAPEPVAPSPEPASSPEPPAASSASRAWDAPAPPASASSGASAEPAASGPSTDADDAPLATVHRLHALPEIPRPAAPSPAASAPSPAAHPSSSAPAAPTPHPAVSWDGPASFSDGVPIPDEPADDGEAGAPEDTWSPAPSVSAAVAAARAAARGQAVPGRGRPGQPGRAGAPGAPSAPGSAGSPGVSLEDDTPSEDDEDAEEAGVVGLEVVKRLLGATVLEEVTVTQEGR